MSINNLGIVLFRQGKYEEAEAMHQRALQGREKVLGPEHPHTDEHQQSRHCPFPPGQI